MSSDALGCDYRLHKLMKRFGSLLITLHMFLFRTSQIELLHPTQLGGGVGLASRRSVMFLRRR